MNHLPQVYADEYVFVNVAQNFIFDQKDFLCTSRLTFECISPSYNAWPIGVPFLYYLVFAAIGLKFSFLYFFNSIIGSLTVLLVFFLAYLFFRKEKVALFLSLIVAIYPIHMKLSGSFALGVSSLFFMLLTLIIFFVYSEKQSLKTRLLLLLSLVIVSHMRLENFLILAFIIPYYFINIKKRKQDAYFLIFYLALMVPFILNVFLGFNHSMANWNVSLSTHIESFRLFFMSNSSFLLQSYSNLFLITILFAIGLFFSFKNKKVTPFIYWFIFVFVFITSYSGGNFYLGTNYRYALIVLIPILFIVGKGLEYVVSKLTLKQETIIILVFATLLLMWPFFHKDFLFSGRDWHESHYLYNDIGKSFDADCLIFKYYETVYDNPLILSSKINFKIFEPTSFKEEQLSDIKSFKCRKFIVETYNESVSKEINITLGNNYIQGVLESMHKLSNNVFIYVYNLSDAIKPKN